MPLFGTFSSGSSRALGLRNGSPPLPPTITAPADNDTLTGSGNTTNRINTTVTFTSTVTSFAIDRFEYKLDRLNSNDTIHTAGTWQTAASAGATSFLISNLLTSTKYGLYMRTVDLAGLTSEETSRFRFTTAAEVFPTAPTPSLSATALSVTITYAAGTAGTYSIGTREYSLHPTTGGTTTYVPFTGTVTRTTRTDTGAALVPGNNYTVAFRYTASSPGTGVSTTSNTISTSAEVANSAPSVSINSQTNTNVTFSRGTSSGGTYGVSYYEWEILNSSNTVTNSGTMSTSTTSLDVSAGVSPDATFTVRVRPRSLTSGTYGNYGSVGGQLNPDVPAAPTNLNFSGMTESSYGTVNLTFSKPDYATSGFVVVSSGTAGATGTGTFAATLSGSTFSASIGSQSHNATYTYRAYVRTRTFLIGGTTSTFYDSGLSNIKTWNTPNKNVEKTWRGSDFGQAYYFPDYTYVIKTNACEPYRLSYLFGPSGIPDDENAPGYARVDRMQATFIPGLQLYRPSDGALFTQDGLAEKSLANVSTLRFSYGTAPSPGGTPTSPSSALPTNAFGGALSNFGGATTVYRYVSIGGSALHNKVFWAEKSDLGKSWSSYPGCTLSTTGSYFAGKLFELVGVVTTPGSFS